MTGNEEWILYNNVEWKRLWVKESEHHQPHTEDQSSSKEVDIVYMVGLKGSPDHELLPENQTINSKKYCSQLG